MFSQASVNLFTGGARMGGGMHGRGGKCEAGVLDMCGGGGACMAGGMHGRGACIGRHGWWGVAGGVHGRGACMAGGCTWQGGVHGRGACVAGEMATAAGDTHPTGMHSCCELNYWLQVEPNVFC